MDYSENLKVSEASDFAYAKWYAAQPDARKSSMISSGFKFVSENVRTQVKFDNPFATNATVMLRFIELTQKADFPPETFAFIEQKMAERSEREWQQRFKAMKKHLGWSYNDMAKYMGAGSGNSVKASVNRQLPAFAKLAVCVFEQLSGLRPSESSLSAE